MAIKYHNPKSVSLAGKYSLGAEIPVGARILSVSGQVGVDSRGKLQPTFEKQAAQVFKNIAQVLKAGGMGFKDIVKMTTFLTDARFVGSFRTVRELIRRIERFIVHYNSAARPFSWTATADSILAKVERLAKAINGTSH